MSVVSRSREYRCYQKNNGYDLIAIRKDFTLLLQELAEEKEV